MAMCAGAEHATGLEIGEIDEDCISRDMVFAFAARLERIVASSTSHAPCQKLTGFYALQAPHIGIGPYFERLYKYAGCSRGSFILAAAYLDRVLKRNSDFMLNNLNAHRLLLACVVVATKFNDDFYHTNSWYAQVGGVSNTEMNNLEAKLLRELAWGLHIPKEEYVCCLRRLATVTCKSPGDEPVKNMPPAVAASAPLTFEMEVEDGPPAKVHRCDVAQPEACLYPSSVRGRVSESHPTFPKAEAVQIAPSQPSANRNQWRRMSFGRCRQRWLCLRAESSPRLRDEHQSLPVVAGACWS